MDFEIIIQECSIGDSLQKLLKPFCSGGGRVVRRCRVNFQCRGVLLIWILVGQGAVALAIVAGGGCLDIFSLNYHFSFLSPFLWETARYRLKNCLKGPLNPEQPTNQRSAPLNKMAVRAINGQKLKMMSYAKTLDSF